MTEDPHRKPPPIPARPLGYQSPRTGGSRIAISTIPRFFAGLFLGAAISALVWILGWNHLVANGGGGAVLAVPGLKLLAGVVFLCFRGWRSFAAGILVSIALGFMIFFGVCVAHMN